MKLKPLNDWAVIVPSEAEVRTAGGIFIPDTAKEKPAEGMVEAIGPGALEEEGYGKKKKEKKDRKFIPTTVKPGERVLYESFAGQKITIGTEERVLVRERNILGILPPKATAPKEELPPLQIPSVPSSSGETAIIKKRGPGAAGKGPAKAKKTAKKGVKKAAKKSAKKKGQGSSSKRQGKAKKKTVKKAKKKR
jgi:chaperonin GroES